MEQEEETKTASDNQLRLVFGHSFMYGHLYTEDEVGVEFAGQEIYIQGIVNDTVITVNNGQCYAISFYNAHLGDAYLIQNNNNDTLIHHVMDGTIELSELYYFNVDSSQVSIGDYNASLAKLIDIQYFDLLGRAQKTSYFHHLPPGIYIEVKRFDNGKFEQRKRMKLE